MSATKKKPSNKPIRLTITFSPENFSAVKHEADRHFLDCSWIVNRVVQAWRESGGKIRTEAKE